MPDDQAEPTADTSTSSTEVFPRGVVPPVATPLTADREVDEPSLRRLVRRLITAGVDGLFALGSTGESAFLPDRQRLRVAEIIVDEVAGAVPVLAAALDPSTTRVIDTAKVLTKVGVAGVVVTAPFYGIAHPAEISRHFRRIAEAVEVPTIAYDIPVAVGAKLAPELVAELAADGTLRAVKDSSGDDAGLRRVLELTHDIPGFAVLTGSEVLADLALYLGVHGIVPGLGNVDPDGYVRLYRAAVAGDWALARAEQERLIDLFRIVEVADGARVGRATAGVGSFKEALVQLGVIETATLPEPLPPLVAAERERIGALVRGVGLHAAR